MPEVELVVNLTIPAVHASVALQAIRAGKHVYGEKPFALSVQEAQTVTAAATACGVQVGNAPDTFLGAALQTARRLIEEGRIGTPISAKATFGYPGPDAWHPSPEFLFQQGGGPLLDMGPYYLTALVQMLGPVKAVSGFGSRAQDKRTIGSGPRAGETFDVTVEARFLNPQITRIDVDGEQVKQTAQELERPWLARGCRGPCAKGLWETGGWHNRLCYGFCQAGDVLEQVFCSLWLCLVICLAAAVIVFPQLSPRRPAPELCA